MNRVNVVKEYEIVNAALTWIGQDPIEIPSEGTDRQKIEFLLNTYAERLKRNVSKYRYIKNNRLIPDMVVQHLISVLEAEK